jgi:transcriptional regulator with PAS, ATPase and Fis domain
MERVFRLMESAIGSPITVLLQGETGVGKEVVARAIHFESRRRDRPFVAVNCGAFPETLLESELFGYRKGAFTGAVADKRGLFEAAHGGTIFLDEIADTPPLTQVKLLRVLESGEFTPLGSTEPRRVDTRVISATNRDLHGEVGAGRFREDLYYRLNAFPILVPPLRERRDDIPVLAGFLLQQLVAAWGTGGMSIAPDAMESLVGYRWPGNVRELRHELERAVTLAGDLQVLDRSHFSERVVGSRERTAAQRARGSLREARLVFEKEYVARVLEEHAGNVSHSARALGISRVMLQRKMKEYGLRAAFRRPAK